MTKNSAIAGMKKFESQEKHGKDMSRAGVNEMSSVWPTHASTRGPTRAKQDLAAVAAKVIITARAVLGIMLTSLDVTSD